MGSYDMARSACPSVDQSRANDFKTEETCNVDANKPWVLKENRNKKQHNVSLVPHSPWTFAHRNCGSSLLLLLSSSNRLANVLAPRVATHNPTGIDSESPLPCRTRHVVDIRPCVVPTRRVRICVAPPSIGTSGSAHWPIAPWQTWRIVDTIDTHLANDSVLVCRVPNTFRTHGIMNGIHLVVVVVLLLP